MGGGKGEANGRGAVRENGGVIDVGRRQAASNDDAARKTDDVMTRDITGVVNNCVNDVMMKDVDDFMAQDVDDVMMMNDVIDIDDDKFNIVESTELKKFDTVT